MTRHSYFVQLFCVLLVLCGASCATNSSPLTRFQFEQPQMGVPFTVVLYAQDQAQAEKAAQAAFKRIAQLNDIFSDYETDSELNQLSRTSGRGQSIKVSEELWTVLAAAQKLASESDGAFDITVGPCVTLWRKARREQQLPDSTRLAEAKKRTGYQHLHLDPSTRTANLALKNMKLDLGGIAKGFAADEAIRILRQHGIRRALVAASGDITVADPPPSAKGWRVELTGYSDLNGPTTVLILLRNASVATSGDLVQRLEIDGVRYSHILDPYTCLGLTNNSLVSVIAPTGLQADPLATTLCILPPEKAAAFAEKKGIAARIIQQDSSGLQVIETTKYKKLTFISSP
jgi:FAD:protein FMN transferase